MLAGMLAGKELERNWKGTGKEKETDMTGKSQLVRRLSRRAMIALAVGAVLVITVVAGILTVVGHRPPHPHPVSYSSQVELPFTHLRVPFGIAVDAGGSLYVTSYNGQRVWKLAAGAGASTVLPFTDLKGPTGVAVDTGGNLYVADASNRVLKLAPGASAPTVLPLGGLQRSWGVAVDTAGNVYVAEGVNDRVLKLPVG